ncbi:hypothetical protein [Actinomadura monticuli]|uniref:Uncharacterized protein n=1 Tax=Actinomadura monticuli TaxID=3097367 RepID=A0ABV4QHS9_9ACTN
MIDAVHGLDLHSMAVLLHLLLFVYWLGGDLGVFYASRFILRPDLSPEARAVGARVMSVVDMAPRVCLVLFLPSGVTLMAAGPFGRDLLPGWTVALAWAGGLAWLALVLYDHVRGATPLGRVARLLDLAVRGGLAAGLLGVAAYTIAAPEPFGVTTNPRWLGAKAGAYALCILGGVMIRWRLRPFGPAFARLMAAGSSPEVERDIRASVRGCLPYVYAVWAMVLLAAFLGVVKPGTTAYG